MARADFVNRVKEIIYGTSLGEHPPLRIAAANANESVSGSLATFTLASGEGDKVKAGHILAADDAADPLNCHAVYVTSISTDTITGRNGHFGTPVVVGADSGDLDNAILEQNPLVTTYKIHKAIDTIIGTQLWPHVFKYVNTTVTPNLATGQADLPAACEDISSAWQTIGGIDYKIPFRLHRNVHTTVSANGVLGEFDYLNGSTAYVSYVAKLAVGDEDEDVNGLVEMVATGAAALCLGASVAETSMAEASKDSQQRQQRDVAASLWRDFITLRSSYSDALGRQRGEHIRVDRG